MRNRLINTLLVINLALVFVGSDAIPATHTSSPVEAFFQGFSTCDTLANKADFKGLGSLGKWSVATGVSCDGETVIGRSDAEPFQEAFLWTTQDGMQGLGTLPVTSSISESYAEGISVYGDVIVGGSLMEWGDQNIQRAFRWENGQMTDLGTLGHPNLPVSMAYDVSADGSIIVGGVNGLNAPTPGTPQPEAVVWDNGTVYGLGQLPNGHFSEASAISADGSVVVGYGYTSSGTEAFRWENGQMISLGDLSGGDFDSKANAASDDGSVIVGDGETSAGPEAFRWENGQMIGLGLLPGSDQSYANDVSGDGSIVIGHAAGPSGIHATIWDATNGTRRLQDVLINDFDLESQLRGWHLTTANAISPDGRTIVGVGINPSGIEEAWRAILVLPERPDLVITTLEAIGPPILNSETGNVRILL